MCSIYTLKSNQSLVGKYFAQEIRSAIKRESDNVHISEETMVITTDEPNVIQCMHFGLVPYFAPSFKMAQSTFNAKKENLLSSRLWAPLFIGHKRCLIIADGFTEPQKVSKSKTQHWRFTVPGQELISFAGLWDEWYDKSTGDRYRSFALITVPSNELVGEVHEKQRMPAILDVSERDLWLSKELSTEQYLNLLKTWPHSFMTREKYDPFNKPKPPPSNDLLLPF